MSWYAAPHNTHLCHPLPPIMLIAVVHAAANDHNYTVTGVDHGGNHDAGMLEAAGRRAARDLHQTQSLPL